ncbi:MAG: hypothetical protein EXQ69_03285 [Acidimicrobiia bacterium]|nr:hypothetical protein [Acidimicrobiia bacterium]
MTLTACAQCGTIPSKGTRFCRDCGVAVTAATETPIPPGRNPPWIVFGLFAVALAVVGLAAVLLVTRSSDSSKSEKFHIRKSTPTSPTSVTTTVNVPILPTLPSPAIPTTRALSGSSAFLFPQSGWITLVASLDKRTTSLDHAISDANARRSRGVGLVNVLDSDQYSDESLRPGLWIEYLGPHATRAEGDAACNDLHLRGLAAPGTSGCYTKPNPLFPG